MSLPVVAWLASILADPATGVNAQLALAPALPIWPTPPPVTVFSEDRFDWVGVREVPPQVFDAHDGFLVVQRTGVQKSDTLPGSTGWSEGACLVCYLARRTPGDGPLRDGECATRTVIAWQTMRSVERVINRALPGFVQQLYPTVAGCEIAISDENVFDHDVKAPMYDGAVLIEPLLVRYRVHDSFALGLDPQP